jgi:TonB-dependent SusC/RagA subfamily outer membrane receptor
MTSAPLRVLPISLIAAIAAIAACAHSRDAASEPEPLPPRAPTLAQMLTGRFPGVIVTTVAGGGISVRISGPHSFSLNQEPLYEVDNTVVATGPNGALAWLNPEDVESIEVLKYDSQTAFYGVRGSNGVIRIKTKGAH